MQRDLQGAVFQRMPTIKRIALSRPSFVGLIGIFLPIAPFSQSCADRSGGCHASGVYSLRCGGAGSPDGEIGVSGDLSLIWMPIANE
ncbi:hypothetical protein [Dichotomicrobium thermohalophilum]|uniref:hypothetical protein n=1 Tax=Dichotomicrobium thermohalophilum TaxID=933063 RepID=UPI000E5BA797|nr:hypothetical protein [Dichotomicrobium thermohalophilum]